MTWLLKLYPPRWRRRYGAELAELIAAKPVSIGLALDLIAGAIDAWLHPRLAEPSTPDPKGDTAMIATLRQLDCAGCGADVSARDRRTRVAVMLGGTLVLTMLWLWAQWRFRNEYLTAVAPMMYFVPYMIGLRYTSLKRHSARAQAILIVGVSAVLTALLLIIGWIGTKI